MSKLLIVCLALFAVGIYAHSKEERLRETLYQRRVVTLRHLQTVLVVGNARDYIPEFTQIFTILRSLDLFENQRAQIDVISESMSDDGKALVKHLVPAVQKSLDAVRLSFAGASPSVHSASEEIINICLNIDILLNLNGQLQKLKEVFDSMDSATFQEFMSRSISA